MTPVHPRQGEGVAEAVERGSVAWFRDRAGKLGCDNWRGPDTVRYAADRIEALEAALSSQAEALEAMAGALERARWYVADHQDAQPNDESRDLLAVIDEVLK